ncbi:TetR/AcrR family transcriptional regulator C-terminal domain-containing protein [bacterium 210917-DFI.7.65]|uniref:TetR/AcrR family transcriptional regulator C-terminal domain-containing protein n=1 Tax=Ruthenibacterium lactatiformans TaxID=1550024 RepID=UPI002A397F3A|nr:TetR/AcrR family transcriptional regulator C-terminal domain-containing protein [bacterium 210917-DFI.7.65]
MANATKHALAGALLELLNTTTLDNITVKDIVERAQVSRQTFYYHFGDVYQLLDWAFQRAIRELGEMPEENWRDRLLMAVEFLRANRALAMNVYHSLGMEHLARGLEAAVRDLLGAAPKDAMKWLPADPEDQEFLLSFFSYGVMGIIIRWLDDGMPEKLDHMINEIYALMHHGEDTPLLPEPGYSGGMKEDGREKL